MKGLLYKEFRMFAFQVKTWAAVLAFLMVFCLIAGQTGPFVGGMCGFVVISSLAPFTEEKKRGSDAYTAALPVSRREIVKARYSFLLLLDLTAAAVFGLCGMAAGWFLGESMAETVMGLAAVMIISLILQLILLPAVYWLGEMKARIVFLAFVLASVFLITALSFGSWIPVTEETVMTGLVAGLFFAAALLVPSYLLSAAAMERKDF